jgi:hypothetical protein
MQLPLVWTLNWLSAVSWFAYHMDDLALATANHDGITDKLLRLISIYIFPWSSTCERQRSLGHLGPILVLLRTFLLIVIFLLVCMYIALMYYFPCDGDASTTSGRCHVLIFVSQEIITCKSFFTSMLKARTCIYLNLLTLLCSHIFCVQMY